jgi:hypothetical protein
LPSAERRAVSSRRTLPPLALIDVLRCSPSGARPPFRRAKKAPSQGGARIFAVGRVGLPIAA